VGPDGKIEHPESNSARTLASSPSWQSEFLPGVKNGEAWRMVTRIDIASEPWYLVPMGLQEAAHLFIALSPTPSSGTGRPARWMWLGGLFSAAIVLLTFIAWQSRRLSLAQQDLARLRAQPAAVIETLPGSSTTDDEQIVFGNDRAEELLHTEIQRFGLQRGPQPSMWAIFNKTSHFEMDSYGQPGKAITRKDIDQQRRQGLTSSYFLAFNSDRVICHLNDGRPLPLKWVRITGGPIVLPQWKIRRWDARGHLDGTLGIVTPEFSETIVRILDDKYAARPRDTP
jgi:hypothetical protein